MGEGPADLLRMEGDYSSCVCRRTHPPCPGNLVDLYLGPSEHNDSQSLEGGSTVTSRWASGVEERTPVGDDTEGTDLTVTSLETPTRPLTRKGWSPRPPQLPV